MTFNMLSQMFNDTDNGFGEFDIGDDEVYYDLVDGQNNSDAFTYSQVKSQQKPKIKRPKRVIDKNFPDNHSTAPKRKYILKNYTAPIIYKDVKVDVDRLYSVDKKRVCPSCSSFKSRINQELSGEYYKHIEYYDVVPVFMVERKNSKTLDKFLGCPNFPKCRFTINLKVDKPKFLDYDDEIRPF